MEACFRHEMKFVISEQLYFKVKQVLKEAMPHDIHADENKEYNIRSLYFDDIYKSAYMEKIDGVQFRKKYRIRIYNCSDNYIALECKHKNSSYIYKESINITKDEYNRIINGDILFLLKKDKQIAKEFFVDSRKNILRPKVIVEYEREAFVYSVGNVRITFDKNLRAILCNEDIFNPKAQSFGILPNTQMILEIKYTDILPKKIRKILRTFNATQTSASKYCMCVDKIEGVLRI